MSTPQKIHCIRCGAEMYEQEVSCPACGTTNILLVKNRKEIQAPPIEKVSKDPPPDTTQFQESARAQGKSSWGKIVAVIIGFALSAIAFFGHYHIVSSSTSGTFLTPKVCFSLAETFVSVDAITGQPFITAKARYPLTVKALQREGILETDEQFDGRIRREAEQKFQETMDRINQQ